MDRATRIARALQRRGLLKYVPVLFFKHWVVPSTVGARRPYDAKRYFESWYAVEGDGALSDALTISPAISPTHTRFHYNATENAILSALEPVEAAPTSVLDIGSGAGHWLDFYRGVWGVERAVGVELSEVAAAQLARRFADTPSVRIVTGDASDPGFALHERFDVINAIGVMFHIVDDAAWEQALRNLARHLAPGGRIVVGGQFGWLTRDVQFHDADAYTSWDDRVRPTAGEKLVNKRIRSLRRWRKGAARAGLRVERVVRAARDPSMVTPESNVLVLVAR